MEDWIKDEIEKYFYIDSEPVKRNGVLSFRGTFRVSPEEGATHISRELRRMGFSTVIRKVGIDLFEIHIFKERKTPPQKIRIHLILFILTLLSTLFVGALQRGANPLDNPGYLLLGIPFSLSLLLILGIHEFGHFFVAKRHGVDATLPYFIPFPNIVGTLGAVIRIRSPIPSKNALIDIGAAGPLAGIAVAIPLTILGLKLSHFVSTTGEGGFLLGNSILFGVLTKLSAGGSPEGYNIMLHPVAFAGWIGLFVTSLNLMPAGQLDGGHIAYALLGKNHRKVALITVAILFLMGIFFWQGWLFWGLLLTLMGLRHPAPLNEILPLSKERIWIGRLCLVVFIITFTPVPFIMH